MDSQPADLIVRRLRQLLAAQQQEAAVPGGAMVQGRFPAAQLSVSVVGAGPLSVPATDAELAALRAHAEPAPFGLREQTFVDPAVRDTDEIDAAALTLVWAAGAEDRLRQQIAEGLGLERVELTPHKLLSYAPGQFFKPHQDTAREPEMVGTLVLIWPSPHLGGELRVRHGDSAGSFASEQLTDTRIRWCAFYADCQHEVLPVTEGQRIAISFEVRVPGGLMPSRESADPLLTQALQDLFGSGAGARQQPWFLLLDHQYSERGLLWRALKGRDRPLARAIRAAAGAAGYTVGLVLIEQLDVWNWADRSPRGWVDAARDPDADDDDFDDDDEFEDDSGSDPEESDDSGSEDDESDDEEFDDDESDDEDFEDEDFEDDFDDSRRQSHDDDLIDRSSETLLWVDAEDRVISRERKYIQEDQLAALRPSGAVHRVNSEYEGHMGNYGETMSFWYRRAALVVQSPTVALRRRYETAPDAAARALAERAVDPRQAAAVGEEIATVRDLLDQNLHSNAQAVLPALLEVAATLPRDDAAVLLNELHHASLGVASIPALIRLQSVHGLSWLRQQFAGWIRKAEPQRWRQRRTDGLEPDGAPDWPEPVDECIAAALRQGLDPGLIRDWQLVLVEQFVSSEKQWRGRSPRDRQQQRSARVGWTQRMLRALAVGDPTAAEAPLAQALRAIRAGLHRLPEQAESIATLADMAHPLVAELRAQLLQELTVALAEAWFPLSDQGLRRMEWVCRCRDCAPVIAWAESTSAASYDIAVAEARRRHIVDQFNLAAAPIRFDTIRQGSPYTLRCDKDVDAARLDADWRQSLVRAQRQLQSPSA